MEEKVMNTNKINHLTKLLESLGRNEVNNKLEELEKNM